jgi:surfeit locus 1 family protein
LRYCKLPPIRVHLFGCLFSPSLVSTLATLFLLPVLIGLGMWQLDRAAEKKALEKEFANKMSSLSITAIQNVNDPHLRYRRLQVTGYFDNEHTLFIDNKTYHQKIGYHVVTPFIIPQQERVLLLNRGFIEIKNRKMPLLKNVLGLHTLSGLIYFPSKSFMLKKEADNKVVHWPMVLQTIDLKHMEGLLDKHTYPFYLLLEKGDEQELVRDWHPVNFPSYRHTGYAVQWFLLAFTLIVIYFSLNTVKDSQTGL